MAAHPRQRADGGREHGRHRSARTRFRIRSGTGARRRRQAVELHEVRRMVGVEHLLLPPCGRPARLEQRPQHAHRGQRQRVAARARHVERLGEQSHDLGVGLGALLPDALDAHLRELARLRLHLRLGLAEHALQVAEPERPRLARQARCRHARNLQGDVGAHGQKVAARIEEAKRGAGQTATRPHDVHDLERGRLDGQVPARRETLLHGARDALALLRLVREHIAESCRCHIIHRFALLSLAVLQYDAARMPGSTSSASPAERRAGSGARSGSASVAAAFIAAIRPDDTTDPCACGSKRAVLHRVAIL